MYQTYNKDKKTWNNYVKKNKLNYRSLYEWGEYKESLGWKILRFIYTDDLKNEYYFQCTYKIKFFFGAFYIPNGLIDKLNDIESLKLFLKNYSNKKIIYIRLDDTKRILKKNNDSYQNLWSRPLYRVNSSKSAILDLNKYLNKDHKLSNNYKKNLKKSKKFENEIVITNVPNPEDIVEITTKMNQLKKMEIHSFRDFELMNSKLSKYIKFVIVYDSDKNPISYRGALIINKCSWELCAANSYSGRIKSCGYLTMDIMSKKLQKLNIDNYDLGAVIQRAQGVSEFKISTGADIYKYIGEYEYCNIFFFKYLINLLIALSLSRRVRKIIPLLSRFNY